MTSGRSAPRPLVIGYGNPLRADDGVGWQVANHLATDPRAGAIDVIAVYQLAPEYAEDLHTASLTVLVDAKVDDPALAPGEYTVARVVPDPRTPHGGWTHHRTPAALATLSQELYGSVSPILAVGVGISSVAPTDRLTDPVARAVPRLVDLILGLTAQPSATIDDLVLFSKEYQDA